MNSNFQWSEHNALVSFPSCIRSNIFIVSCKGSVYVWCQTSRIPTFTARTATASLYRHAQTPLCDPDQSSHIRLQETSVNLWELMREQVACQVHSSLLLPSDVSILNLCSFIVIGCLKRPFFLHASVHETNNLHARRWWLELLSIFHRCCRSLISRIEPDVSVRVLPSSTNRM